MMMLPEWDNPIYYNNAPDGHHRAVPRPLTQPHVGVSLGVQAEAHLHITIIIIIIIIIIIEAHPGEAAQLRHLQARPVAEEDDTLEHDSCDSLMTA